MNLLIHLLSENGSSDGVSTMRVCSLLVVLSVLGTWATVSIQQKSLQPFSPELAGLVIGTLGIKAWQRGREQSETPPQTPHTP